MSPRLAWNGYGKADVRLFKVNRGDGRHEISDLTVSVQLQGKFQAAHTSSDNSAVLPTDTMKNSVYILARQGPVDPPEAFGERLARHFLTACPASHTAVVSLAMHRWDRAGDHTFIGGTPERRIAWVTVRGEEVDVESGLEGLRLLKTTGSGFAGFLRDGHTTLAETDDRIFATEVNAHWDYSDPDEPVDYDAAWTTVRNALITTFAGHQSASVQQTLYAMGEAALAECSELEEIRLILPNRHHLLVDLGKFGLENRNEIFVPTSEPYGRIEAVITR